MRIWLHYLYKDLYAIPATHFSIDRDNWDSVLPCITPEMIFRARPPGTAIPIQGKLISVRHQPVECPDDLLFGCVFEIRTPPNVHCHQKQ